MLNGNLSAEGAIIQSRIRFTLRDTQADPALYPRVRFQFEVSHSGGTYNLLFEIVRMDLTVMSKGGVAHHLGHLLPDPPYLNLSPNNTTNVLGYLELDHSTLSRVENVREGGDLQMQLLIHFVGEQQGAPQTKQNSQVGMQIRIPKSDWVERILPNIGFKDVALIEIPKLVAPNFKDVVDYQNEAWRQFMMGEYDKVLVECRKSLEALATHVRDKGLEAEADGKKVPDWDKLLGNDESGGMLGTIFQKIRGFVAPGSHAGRSTSRDEGEFALMVTHAIVSLGLRKLMKIT
jgi:hypothetical protein